MKEVFFPLHWGAVLIGGIYKNNWLYPRFPIRENNINPTYSEHGAIITVFENLQKSVREDQRHQLRGKSYP
jgi:hypothetical protein